MLILAGALVFSFPVLKVWQHVYTVKLAKENQRLKNQVEELNAKRALLSVFVSGFLSREAIENIAKNTMKLNYTKPDQVVFINDNF